MTRLPLPGPLVAYIQGLFPALPPIAWGKGAPTTDRPKASLWLRTDGAPGSLVYVSHGGGTWAAIA